MPNLIATKKVIPTDELLPKPMADAISKTTPMPFIFQISDAEFKQLNPAINSIQEQVKALANHAMQQDMAFMESGLLEAHKYGMGFAFKRTLEVVQSNRREDRRCILKRDFKITDLPPNDPEWVFITWQTIDETVQRMRVQRG